MKKKQEWKKGNFNPKFPEKCMNVTLNKPIIYRSSWEQRFMSYCDTNANVLEWGSETVIIPYIYDYDKRLHKYHPDFLVKMKKEDGSISTYLIEVKPEKQLKQPAPPKNRTKKALANFKYSLTEYVKNKNKWKYARRYCEPRNWEFKIMTEKELF